MYLDTNSKYHFFYQNKSNNKKSLRKKEEVRKDSLSSEGWPNVYITQLRD